MGTSKQVSLKGTIPSQSMALGKVVALRKVASGNPVALSVEEAEQLIADARAGKLVSLFMDAVVYVQNAKPNRNWVRIRNGARTRLAASGAGVPFMRDHAHYNTQMRGGRVVESKVEDLADGEWQILQTFELTAPWAVEDALRGLIDRFSVSWESTGDTVCSICGEPMTVGWFSVWSECDHNFGAEYDGVFCQLEYTDAQMLETSTVSVPAVLGTDVDSIRQALSANRALMAPRSTSMSMPKLFALLALSATATEDEAVTAVEGLQLRLSSAEQSLSETRSKLSAAEAELGKQRAEQLSNDTEALIDRGVAEGRFLMQRNAKGERTETPIEKTIRHLAKNGGMEAARQFVEAIEPVHAIGRSQVETVDNSKSAPPGKAEVQLTATQLAWCKKNGVDPEAYAKTIREERAA